MPSSSISLLRRSPLMRKLLYNNGHRVGSTEMDKKSSFTWDEQDDEKNFAGDCIWPVLWMLKLGGLCPLSRLRVEETRVVVDLEGNAISKTFGFWEYKIIFRSWFMLWTLFQGLMSATSWLLFFLAMTTGRKFISNDSLVLSKQGMKLFVGQSSNEQTSAVQTISAIFYVIPALQFLELVFAWGESRGLGTFLNNFRKFQQQFRFAFPFAHQIAKTNVNRVRNLFLGFYVLIPTLISLPFFMAIGNLEATSVAGFWISFLYGIQMVPASLLEDVKVLLTYFILGEAFRQVKGGIAYSKKWESLSPEKVKSWRKVVHTIRLLTTDAGNWQKAHQLSLFMGSIILITSSGFILLNGNSNFKGYVLLFLTGSSYILLIAGRIYLKIYAASRISYEESMIARELIFINLPEHEFATQMEIKFLHDMIKQKPCLVNFGSYVTLNKRLLLGMASQVVTYLIVLMQFSQS